MFTYIKYLFLSFLILPCYSKACSPVEPEMIPPTERGGEFMYVYPPSFMEDMLNKIESSNDIALIKAKLVWPAQNGSKEYAEIEVLYGWGYHKSKFIKLYRESYSCGEFTKLKAGQRYVAFMVNGVPKELIEHSKVADRLEARGEPEYIYTAIGLLK